MVRIKRGVKPSKVGNKAEHTPQLNITLLPRQSYDSSHSVIKTGTEQSPFAGPMGLDILRLNYENTKLLPVLFISFHHLLNRRSAFLDKPTIRLGANGVVTCADK